MSRANFLTLDTHLIRIRTSRGRARRAIGYSVHGLHRPAWEGAQYLSSGRAWGFLEGFHAKHHPVQIATAQPQVTQ